MKKVIAVMLLICLPFALFSKKNLCDFAAAFPGSTVTVYAEDFSDIPSVNNCGLKFAQSTSENAVELYRNAKNVQGVTVSFSGSVNDFEAYLSSLKAKEVYREKIFGKTVIYAYSARIRTYVVVNNHRVNLQFCFDNTLVKIGSPLLLGSY